MSKQRMKIRQNQYGFTLIEVIASLVIIGILATMTSVGISNIFKGYLFTKDNAETALRAQVALTRLMKELSSVEGVAGGSKTSLTYSFIKNGVSVPNRILSWSGTANDPLMLGENILTQDVRDFELSYHNSYNDAGDNTWDGTEKMIGITLRLNGAMGVVSPFSIRIVPRNL